MNDSRGDNCKDMRELLSAYRDAELDANERPVVEAHLNSCSDCREELAAVESVVKSLKSLPPVTLSRDFSLDVESLIKRSEAETAKQAQTEEKVISITRKKPVVWIAAAAAAVVVMVVAYVGITGGGVPMVATSGGVPQETIAAKDVPPAVPDTAVQEKPLVAESGVQSSSSLSKVINPEESIASIGKPVTSVVQTAKDTTQAQASKPVVVAVKTSAPKRGRVIHVDDLADNQALVAFSEPNEENEVYENIGISTDEDGLYAIKM